MESKFRSDISAKRHVLWLWFTSRKQACSVLFTLRDCCLNHTFWESTQCFMVIYGIFLPRQCPFQPRSFPYRVSVSEGFEQYFSASSPSFSQTCTFFIFYIITRFQPWTYFSVVFLSGINDTRGLNICLHIHHINVYEVWNKNYLWFLFHDLIMYSSRWRYTLTSSSQCSGWIHSNICCCSCEGLVVQCVWPAGLRKFLISTIQSLLKICFIYITGWKFSTTFETFYFCIFFNAFCNI